MSEDTTATTATATATGAGTAAAGAAVTDPAAQAAAGADTAAAAGAQADPWADPEAARREIEKLRKESAGYRTRAKELEPLAAKAKELEDAQKSETEKLADRLTAAEERAAKATRAAVSAKVEALAAATFADPSDAAGALDTAAFVDAEGRIDADAIKTELAALLERKPHWAKTAGPRRPAPDAAQGASGNGRPAASPGEEFAAILKNALQGR